MKKNINDFNLMKQRKEPITWITAYSYPFAMAAEKAGIEMILIGDSGGMVELGYNTTNPVSMDDMLSFARAVRRGAPDTFLVGDMPQGSYETSCEEAVRNAGVAALNGGGGPGDSIPNIGVSNGVINDGGYAFGSYDLNFGAAPDLETVAVGGEGLPASAYVPNLTSPGPGSTAPQDQPEYVGTLPEKGNEYGSGVGAESPSISTPQIASQKIGSYIMGRSYLGSDGRT